MTLKDKHITINLLTILLGLSIIFTLFLSATMLLVISELNNVAKSNNITNYHYTYVCDDVKETVETKDLPDISDKSEFKNKEVPEVKKEIPKVVNKVKEVPKISNKTTGDSYLLAQIIHAEAKGEPYNGKIAVGNVVMNRVKSPSFPNTIKGVIFQKGQFHPVSNGSIYNTPSEEAIKAANEVLNGKQIVGSDALYFYNPKTSTSKWIFTRTTITTIGNHRFAY